MLGIGLDIEDWDLQDWITARRHQHHVVHKPRWWRYYLPQVFQPDTYRSHCTRSDSHESHPIFLHWRQWRWRCLIIDRLSVALMSGLKVSRKILNSHQLPTVLSTKVIWPHCSTFNNTQHLINFLRRFVTISMTWLGMFCFNLISPSLTFVHLSFHAGVQPLAMISAVPHWINDNTFEDAIREYQLEEQDNVEDNESWGAGWWCGD